MVSARSSRSAPISIASTVSASSEGLLRALKLGSPIGGKTVEIARNLEPQGLLLNSPRPDVLRFMPALNITLEEIDLMLEMLSDVIATASN